MAPLASARALGRRYAAADNRLGTCSAATWTPKLALAAPYEFVIVIV